MSLRGVVWGPQKILCTFGEKAHTSKRVSIIAPDNVISKAKCATHLPEGIPLVLKNSAKTCRVFIFILMETIFLLHLGVERLFWTALR